jgi:hypothetical protein
MDNNIAGFIDDNILHYDKMLLDNTHIFALNSSLQAHELRLKASSPRV